MFILCLLSLMPALAQDSLGGLSNGELAVLMMGNLRQTTNAVEDGHRDGHFCEAYIKLFDEMANKNEYQIKDTTKYAKIVIDEMQRLGKFTWLRKMKKVVPDLFASYFTYTNPKVLQVKAKVYRDRMKTRKNSYREDINEVFDVANELFSVDDGDKLFTAIDNFRAYPRVNKSGRMLCQDIVEGFTKPFIKTETSLLFENIFNNVYRIVLREYPEYFTNIISAEEVEVLPGGNKYPGK